MDTKQAGKVLTKKPMTHTPGPWQWDTNGLLVSKTAGINIVRHEAAWKPTQANARLMAAAPDLLAALKGMLDWARRVKEINPGLEIMNAVNAVTDAEGRT